MPAFNRYDLAAELIEAVKMSEKSVTAKAT
jgi:hypothetical protein